jgi:hypothetical protein
VVDGGTSVDDLGVFDEDLPTEPGAAPDEPRMEDNPFEEDAQREVKLKPLVTSSKVIRNILFGAELVKSLDTIWQWVPAVYQLLHPLHKELSGDANAELQMQVWSPSTSTPTGMIFCESQSVTLSFGGCHG